MFRLSIALCWFAFGVAPQSRPTDARPETGVRADRDDLVFPEEHWSRVPSLAAAGWDEKLLDEARRFSESIGSHAVMVVDRGRVVAEWGATDEEMIVQS